MNTSATLQGEGAGEGESRQGRWKAEWGPGAQEQGREEGWRHIHRGKDHKSTKTEQEEEVGRGVREEGAGTLGSGQERVVERSHLVPVLIFTAKASSWSGTRRSVSSLAMMLRM